MTKSTAIISVGLSLWLFACERSEDALERETRQEAAESQRAAERAEREAREAAREAEKNVERMERDLAQGATEAEREAERARDRLDRLDRDLADDIADEE